MRLGRILLLCLLLQVGAFGEKNGDDASSRRLQDDLALYVCSYPGGGQGKLVKFDAETGEKLLDLSGVTQPVDVAIGPNGDIFVTDEGSGQSNVRRFDPDTGLADADPYGDTSSSDYVEGPRGLAFGPGPDGHLYVADTTFTGARVVEFDENGDFVRFLPDDAENPVLLSIEDVACDTDGNLYVTQWEDGWFCDTPGVFKFTEEGGWGLFGETDNLTGPWGLTFGPDGDLYVAEDSSAEATGVYRYNGMTGALKGVYGQTGSRDYLEHPRYLTFGPDDDLYVSDSQDSTVRKFSGPLKPDAGHSKGVFAETSVNDLGPFGLVFGSAGGPPEPPELLVEKLETGEMLLTLTGTQGKSYELRHTSDPTISDFTEWTFGAIIDLEGITSDTWTDNTASGAPTRFYKAAEEQ